MKPAAALDRLPDLAGADVVKVLHRGPASECYLLRRADDDFVLRVDTPLAARLGLDRAGELEILRAVAAEGLGPVPVAADPGAGLLVTQFIPGRNWTAQEMHEPGNLRRLAALVRKLHHITPVGPHLSLRAAVTGYAEQLASGEAAELANEAETLLRRLADERMPNCLCHNDAIPANIIEGGRLWLIDWEYAAIGDPFFELAVVAEHSEFDDALAEKLLSAYVGSVTDDHRRRLHRQRALYLRVWLLWLWLVQKEVGLNVAQERPLLRIRQQIQGQTLP